MTDYLMAVKVASEQLADAINKKDEAYRERNVLVWFLTCMFPAGIRKTDIEGWDKEWHNCVFIDTPHGQMAWHYHDREHHMFAHLPPYEKPWDGHSGTEKYLRLNRLGLDIQAMPRPADIGIPLDELGNQIINQHCAHCGALMATASNIPGPFQPKEGDAALCYACGEVSVFDPTVETILRKPNEEEQAAIDANAGLQAVRAEWKAAQPTLQ
jgi:hypothetical protein